MYLHHATHQVNASGVGHEEVVFKQENQPIYCQSNYNYIQNAQPAYFQPVTHQVNASAQGNNEGLIQQENYPFFPMHLHYVSNDVMPNQAYRGTWGRPQPAVLPMLQRPRETSEDGKRKLKETNFSKAKRRKINVSERPKFAVSAGELFDELSQCYFRNKPNGYDTIIFETKTCTWIFSIENLEKSIFCSMPEENRLFLSDLKDHCLSRRCDELRREKDVKNLYIQVLNNGIHYNTTPELQEFMTRKHHNKNYKYNEFNARFYKSQRDKNITTFSISPWDPILRILETTTFEKGNNIRVDKLLFNESVLKCFQEGSHLKAYRQVKISQLALKDFLIDDIIQDILGIIIELYKDPENCLYAGTQNN